MNKPISNSANRNKPKGPSGQNLTNTLHPDGRVRAASLAALAMKGVPPNVMAETTGHTAPLAFQSCPPISIVGKQAGLQPNLLGRRDWIGLVGLYQDRNRGNELTGIFYTGFLARGNTKARTTRRTGAKLKRDAVPFVNKVLHALRSTWDSAAALGMSLNSTAPLPSLSGTGGSVKQSLLELEEQWAKGSRLQTYRAYLSESRAFQRLAGALVNRPASAFTAHECAKIRDARLAELGESAHQCMANLRQVLRQLKGFPSELVGVFRPHKNRSSHLGYHWTPQDRKSTQ